MRSGRWLATNGEAVYGTRPWRRAEGATREGVPLRFSARGERVYAILLGTPPGPTLTLADLSLADGGGVALLGHGPLRWQRDGDALRVDFGAPLPDAPAHVLELTGAR